MARDDLFFRIRLPEALKTQIQQLAVANHRSANAEIVARLSESIALGLGGYGATANATVQSLEETERGEEDTFAERLTKIEGAKRQMMIESLHEMLGVLEARQKVQTVAAPKRTRKTIKK